jgi:hypothetical protein
MDNFFNSTRIVEIFVKWRIQLAVIVVVTILCSAFFSSPIFITPLYKSDVVIYPSNLAPYSEENVTEQSVEVLNSRDIRDSVVKKFSLFKHWDIDSTAKIAHTLMERVYERRVKFWTTAYEAIKIEVRDPDPKIARDIIYSIIDNYNLKVRSLQKAKAKEVYDNYEYILGQKKIYLDSLKARADTLGIKYGILEYSSQTREVMRAYLSGGRSNSPDVLRLKKNLEEKGIEMLMLRDLIGNESGQYSTMKMEKDRALFLYKREYSFVNLLSKPLLADKKSYPIRSLIVAVSALAALFFSLIMIGIIENRNTILSAFKKHVG